MSKADIPQRVIDRMWRRLGHLPDEVDDACWPWRYLSGEPAREDYAQMGWATDDGRVVRTVTRMVYVVVTGPIPDELVVRHTCDVPNCCNPRHLILGTPAENSADAIARGRAAGVSAAQAAEIRRRLVGGEWDSEIAMAMGLSKLTITNVRLNKSRPDPEWTPIHYIGTARLSEDEVIAARQRHLDGLGVSQIAREIGVSQSTTSAMLHGQTWSWLGSACPVKHPGGRGRRKATEGA